METKTINIANKKIGCNNPCFIIAEIGSNHCQRLELAKELIDAAKEAGADAVKFQSLKYSELYPEENSDMNNLFKEIELKEEWYKTLSDYCNKIGIVFFSCPTYPKAVDLLEDINVQLYKIASPQTATYPQLIEKVARCNKPIIMSTGYCELEDIDKAVKIIQKSGNNKLALLHCISEYPTPFDKINLRVMKKLKEKYNVPVGFSDHTVSWHITLAAVTLGADIIEKHITLSRKMDGPDHFFALEPDEFKTMIKEIRNVEKSMGNEEKVITEKEKEAVKSFVMRANAKSNLDINSNLNKEEDIIFKRTIEGLNAWDIYYSNEIKLISKVYKDQPITKNSIEIKKY